MSRSRQTPAPGLPPGPRYDVYLNGRMLPPGEATLRHDDAAIQHAVGLFETMAVYHGRAVGLEAHLHRLANSAQQLGFAGLPSIDELRQAVATTIAHNHLDRARLRLTVTPGSVSLLRPDEHVDKPSPTVLVVASPSVEYDPAFFDQGVMVIIAGQCANPFDPHAGHKTLNYWSRLNHLRHAAAAGAGEAIYLNITNHLAGGTVSNLFLVRGGELFTPIARGEETHGTLPAPVLPGVTRGTILDLARQADITTHRRMLSVEELLDADEVFLTNASWHVLPVRAVEKKTIADGVPGPVTRSLRAALLETIETTTE